MGYYGCNKLKIERLNRVKEDKPYVATVYNDDMGPRKETKEFETFTDAVAWAAEKMMQLSM